LYNRATLAMMPGMARLTDFTSYADAQAHFASDKLWELFDGDRAHLNIAHECIDRHVAEDNPAVIVVRAEGGEEVLSFRRIGQDSARVARWLETQGVQPGDRVAIMLEPSRAFYAAVFGAIKRGAIAVPLFTLFGPDGVRLRVADCSPRLIVTNTQKAPMLEGAGPRVVVADDAFFASVERFEPHYAPDTAADSLAIFQYTSGTTRELPEAVKHTHRSIVTLMVAAL
jgi:acetyl-CoA synthetase